MNLILLGPPGAGKGTQSRMLSEQLKVPQISTGDILREARRERSPLGLEAESYMKSGKLVPDEVVIGIVEERLQQSDCDVGYILDGFPRTVTQAAALKAILNKKKARINAVVNILVEDRELIARLTGRRLCPKCGAGYHMMYAPSAQSGVCDRCGGELILRDDDKEATIEKRLAVYKQETEPLIEYYEREGLLKNISGVGEPVEIYRRVINALGIGGA